MNETKTTDIPRSVGRLLQTALAAGELLKFKINPRRNELMLVDTATGNTAKLDIELEIEEQVPDLKTPIICYCGGGSRSALVAESLQKMGYENVRSLAGGFRAWKEAGLPRADN